MTEPAPFDAETTPTVTLAGKDWPIPELVWRDLKKCRRQLLDLNARVNAAAETGGSGISTLAAVLSDLSNDDFDILVVGPIVAALQALHPALTRQEFESWPTSETERQMAWLIVRRQSGLFVFSEAPTPGEANGAA